MNVSQEDRDGKSSLSDDDFILMMIVTQVMGKVIFADMSVSDSDIA